MNFKPMLSADASTADLSTLRYPLLVSPKLDGIRCIVWEGVAYSRNARPIRNRFVQKWAADFHNLDGELIVGSPTDPHCLANTQSGVMAFDGEPNFSYHLFDTPERMYPNDFAGSLDFAYSEMEDVRLGKVEHVLAVSQSSLLDHEERWLVQGYEGVMMRHPHLPYKFGRSTMREGGLMKLKRFQDGEATVTGLEEGSVNENTLVRDELGRAKRSKDAGGLRPSGMVGTIIAVDPVWGELRIAPGTMSHHDREWYWAANVHQHPHTIVGKTIHWRSFGYGVKDKPRFPRYYGVREDK